MSAFAVGATLGANANYFEQDYYVPAPRQDHGLTNWNYQSPTNRKPVISEGRSFQHSAFVPEFSDEARAGLDEQIGALRRDYGFADVSVVTDFLTSHRNIRAVLRDAVAQLQANFGAHRIFNLEVSQDEDGSETIYVVAIWQEDARRASEALDGFLESWWLQRMSAATSDLAFIYKLV